jgi:hypothetical protein
MTRPLHLVPDIERHGVARYATEIAGASGCAVATVPPPEPGQLLHLHFTERIWGSAPDAAAARVCDLARRHPLSLTLHDLPQRADGAASERQRAAAYRQVVHAARAVACNSHWETQLLAAFTVPRQPAEIIPLAVGGMCARPPRVLTPAEEPVIALLGFFYPGKGHAEAIDAAGACSASLGRRVGVRGLGMVSAGHEAELRALHRRARRRGVSFSMTGYLSSKGLTDLARQVDVPLAAHQHVSASGSIGSWLSAGRRPLVADSPYAREIDALRPGTIRRYDPSDLAGAVTRALADPDDSWLAPQTDLRPGPQETAAAYLKWWTQDVPW